MTEFSGQEATCFHGPFFVPCVWLSAFPGMADGLGCWKSELLAACGEDEEGESG